jgi:hypothetical protein
MIVVSPVPGERGPAAAERARLQLGESVATARTAETDRQLVPHQRATAPRQDGRGRAIDGRELPETVWAKSGGNTGEVSENCQRRRVRRPEFRSP